MENSFNLGGARLSKAGKTGDENDDVSTKRYVDLWHFPSLGTDQGHYQRYIKSRDFLMVPLTGLCMASTTLQVKGYIHTILESNSNPNTFSFIEQAVVDKCIQVNYLKSVWVEEWIFITNIKVPLDVAFKWQASNDGKTWIDISEARITSKDIPPETQAISVNKGQWNFVNQNPVNPKVQYSYWRLKGSRGRIPSKCYVNIMLMYLT